MPATPKLPPVESPLPTSSLIASTPGHPAPSAPLPPWAALLEHFYARAGLPLPRLERLQDRDVPSPYRALLVHSSDMTPTLQEFHGQAVGLTVLSRELQESAYLREVVLHVGAGERPVEYGVIRIFLDRFPATARRRVLEERRPLGSILESESVGHLSWPQAFFRAESDAHIGAVLRLSQPCQLYGRRNVLLDGSRRLLAEVIEVLPPVANHFPHVH